MGFAQKVIDLTVAASPPDERRGSAAPFASTKQRGFAPGSGSALKIWAKGRTRGAAPRKCNTFSARHSHAAHPAAKPLRSDFCRLPIADCRLPIAD
jgi:hypothetical protein